MQLQIKVFLNLNALNENKPCFERFIDVHEQIIVPYSTIIDTLKFMYGSNVIISFNVM